MRADPDRSVGPGEATRVDAVANHGGFVSPACMSDALDPLADRFARSEASGGCATIDDQADVRPIVEFAINDVGAFVVRRSPGGSGALHEPEAARGRFQGSTRSSPRTRRLSARATTSYLRPPDMTQVLQRARTYQRPTKIWVKKTSPAVLRATPMPVRPYGPSMFSRCARLFSHPRTASDAGSG